MSVKRENVAIVGVGVVACAACCAGPILGFLAAIGLGTAVGFAVFGTVALVLGALAVLLVFGRRRRRRAACASPQAPVAVTVSPPRAGRR